jgi:hypothetical protein
MLSSLLDGMYAERCASAAARSGSGADAGGSQLQAQRSAKLPLHFAVTGLGQLQRCLQTGVDLLHEGIWQTPQLPEDLASVQCEQIDTVHYRILSQPRPLSFGCSNLDQQLRRFQGPSRHTRDLGHNGIQQTLIISVILDHEYGPYLGSTAAAYG